MSTLTCQKMTHLGVGYMHDEDDDTPYFVDGVKYCGRCHYPIDANGDCSVRSNAERVASLSAENERLKNVERGAELMREAIDKAHAVLDNIGGAGERDTNHRGLCDRILMLAYSLKDHNTALAAALATRTKQRDELVRDLAKLDDGERLRQYDHDTETLPLNSNDPAA